MSSLIGTTVFFSFMAFYFTININTLGKSRDDGRLFALVCWEMAIFATTYFLRW